MVVWFQGGKTIVGGWMLILAAVAGVFLGKVSVEVGVMVFGFGLSICGYAAQRDRHHSELLEALEAVAVIGVDLRAGNKHAAIAEASDVITQAVTRQAVQYGPQIVLPKTSGIGEVRG